MKKRARPGGGGWGGRSCPQAPVGEAGEQITALKETQNVIVLFFLIKFYCGLYFNYISEFEQQG